MNKKLLSIFNDFHNPGFSAVINTELWTSATDEGFDDNYVWCNGRSNMDVRQVNWKSGGQPNSLDGNCVFVQFSNQSANLTTFSLGDCTQKRKFMCEVFTYDNYS
jgi:hypothetical protein